MSELQKDLDIFEQLKRLPGGMQLKRAQLETQNIPVSSLDTYIIEQSTGIMDIVGKSIASFQNTLIHDPSPENIDAYSKLIASSTKLLESLNKITTQHKKSLTELQLQYNKHEHEKEMFKRKYKLGTIPTEQVDEEEGEITSINDLVKKLKAGEDITLDSQTSGGEDV